MSIPEKALQLIEFIRYDYPRVASLLRWSWDSPEVEALFDELLTYNSDQNRGGFDTETFWAITELKKIHDSTKEQEEPKNIWGHLKH